MTAVNRTPKPAGGNGGQGKNAIGTTTTAPSVPHVDPKVNSLLDAALAYAARGWHVIPLHHVVNGQCTCGKDCGKSKGKHPMPKGWEQKASTDPATIRRWWRQSPGANVGIACGPSHLVVVDLDIDKGGPESWADLRGRLGFDDSTVTAHTGSGGLHLYYVAPDAVDLGNTAGKLGPGIDTRARGGQVVAPPSISGKGAYTWDSAYHPDRLDVAPLPLCLLELLTAKEARTGPAPDRQQHGGNGRGTGMDALLTREIGHLTLAQEGARNDTLNRAAYTLGGAIRPGGLAEAEVIQALTAAARSTGLPDGEIERAIRSGLEAGKAAPLQRRLAPIAQTGPVATASTTAASTPAEPKEKRPKPTTAEYVNALRGLGYTFRMNMSNDVVEVNGQPISDGLRAKMRTQMRDIGYWHVNEVEDAWTAHAYDNCFHPVRDYLAGLAWDGKDTINEVARYVKDRNDFFPVFLRRWAIGAVARAYEPHGCQNRTLILEGSQGLGKSYFLRWLASKLARPELYVEGPVNPDDKDNSIRLTTAWLWEVSELGATTRRSDREALKFFLSRQQVTVRHPYGHCDSVKPALSSFVGTVNDVGGILDDPTGYRRFMAVHVTAIEWGYATALAPGQFWAQAKALYDAGEPWELHGDELAMARESCAQLEIEDPLDDIMARLYQVTGDPGDFVATVDILDTLHGAGWRLHTPRGEAMALAATMKRMGIASERHLVGEVRQRGFPGMVRRFSCPTCPT